MSFLKMDPVWRHVSFPALCVICVCVLHANQEVITDPKQKLLDCAFRCLQSPKCGWMTRDRTTGQCSTHDFIDCNTSKSEVANNILVMYSRLPSGFAIKTTKRHSTFKLFDATATTCTTSLRSCDAPASVSNGAVEYGTLVPGSVAKQRCNSGFSFCGPVQKEVTCLANGTWEDVGASCFRDTWIGKPPSNRELQCPVRVGTVIEILGTPTEDNKFGFPLFGTSTRIVFYFEVRFPETEVVLNSRKIGGDWDDRMKANSFPFQVGQNFNVTIIVNALQYDMMVNGLDFASFPHRYSIDEIDSFSVWADVYVRRIKFNF